MNFKQIIYAAYLKLLNDKIDLLRNGLEDLRETSSNETKSTAGDKHETALAMLQIDQENISRQLKNALEQKILFEKIDPLFASSKIIKGSLVKTNKGYLFLSVALGKAKIDGISIIALSADSPLGQKLMGLKENDAAEINGIHYIIENIT